MLHPKTRGLLLLAISLLASAGSQAIESRQHPQIATNHTHVIKHSVQKSKAPISEARAAQIARDHSGGKVLKIQKFKAPGGMRYRVKLLLPSGRVTQLGIDANSGAVIAAPKKH